MSRPAHASPARRSLLLLALGIAACGDGGGISEPRNEVGAVTVSAPAGALVAGATLQLAATVTNANGVAISGVPVTWSTSTSAVATVSTAGLVTGVARGAATIYATAGGKVGGLALNVLPPPCTQPTAGTIALGESRSGTLMTGSCRFDDAVDAAGYRLTLTTAARVRIALGSQQFAPLIVLTDPQRGVLDIGYPTVPGLAVLTRDLAAGEYFIWGASQDGLGTYQLTVDEAVVVPCTPRGTLVMGQTVTGTLTPADCYAPMYPDAYAHQWSLVLTEATALRLRLSSTVFDALLFITDAGGDVVAFDDDSGGNLDSQILATLEPGTYAVWATTFQRGVTGSYQLALAPGPARCTAAGAASIQFGETVGGMLSDDACVLLDGPVAQGWSFVQGEAGGIRLTATSSAFAPIIAVTDEELRLVATAVPSGGAHAQLMHYLPPGRYIAWVGSLDARRGAYQLELQTASLEPCAHAGDIALGGTVAGALATGDCTTSINSGTYADAWRLELAQPARVRIDLRSAQFDALLFVTTPEGALLAVDDDGGSDTDSQITLDLAAGVYLLWASTFAPGVTGAYVLSVAPTTAGVSGVRVYHEGDPWVAKGLVPPLPAAGLRVEKH